MCVTATLLVPAGDTALSAAGPFSIAGYLGVCGLVIALLLAGAFVLHRCIRGGWSIKAARRSLRVVDMLPLGGKRQLAIVQVYDRTLVLGLGEGGVRLLCEWDVDSGPLPTAPAPRESGKQEQAPDPRAAKARAMLAALGRAPAQAKQHDDFEAALAGALGAAPAVVTPAAPRPKTRAVQREAAAKPKARVSASKTASAARPEAAAPTVGELLDSEGWVG